MHPKHPCPDPETNHKGQARMSSWHQNRDYSNLEVSALGSSPYRFFFITVSRKDLQNKTRAPMQSWDSGLKSGWHVRTFREGFLSVRFFFLMVLFNCSRAKPGVFFVCSFSKVLCNYYMQPELREPHQFNSNSNHL